MRVGVLGGSFNPAHRGHLHVAQLARVLLGLDQVWLMVSPGNPLKPAAGMAPFAERLGSARAIADGRRVVATGIEAALGTRYTVDTLRGLQRRFPNVLFVWLMGADNLVQLPRWRRWLDIVDAMPIAVLPRPSYNYRALAGQAAQRLRGARVAASRAGMLASRRTPAWTFLPVSEDATSATAIRAARRSDQKEPRHSQKTADRPRPSRPARTPPQDAGPEAGARRVAGGGQDAGHATEEGDRRRTPGARGRPHAAARA